MEVKMEALKGVEKSVQVKLLKGNEVSAEVQAWSITAEKYFRWSVNTYRCYYRFMCKYWKKLMSIEVWVEMGEVKAAEVSIKMSNESSFIKV